MARALSIVGFLSCLAIFGFGDQSFKKLSPYLNSKYAILRESEEANEIIANKTYVNLTVHENQCICSKVYDPVCATNEKSYYNICQMECEAGHGVSVVHQGNCILF